VNAPGAYAARTFGSLFLAIVVLLFLTGGRLFYDAFVPLAPDSDQVLVGSVFVTVALLLGVFMMQGGRQTVQIGRGAPLEMVATPSEWLEGTSLLEFAGGAGRGRR
jgi:hypothetical protein